MFGEEAFKAVGDLAESKWKKARDNRDNAKTAEEKAAYQREMDKWAEGGANKILFHSLVGGIMSSLAGGSFSSGAVGGGVTQALQKELAKITDPEMRLLLSSLVGAAAAKLLGGDGQVGGFTGYTGTKYNDYGHRPTAEGSIIHTKDGYFIVKNGEDVYLPNGPEPGQVFWDEDGKSDEGGALGYEYIVGENGSHIYFTWKNIEGVNVATYDNGSRVIVNGGPIISSEDSANSPYTTWLVKRETEDALHWAKTSLQFQGVDPNDPDNAQFLASVVEKQIQTNKEIHDSIASSIGGGGFKTFKELKAFLGSPGAGNQWHHIVEQAQQNASRARFAAKEINSVENIIALQSGKDSVHSAISGLYSSKPYWTGGLTVRDWLATKSFAEQFEFGMNTLKDYGKVTRDAAGRWIFIPFE